MLWTVKPLLRGWPRSGQTSLFAASSRSWCSSVNHHHTSSWTICDSAAQLWHFTVCVITMANVALVLHILLQYKRPLSCLGSKLPAQPTQVYHIKTSSCSLHQIIWVIWAIRRKHLLLRSLTTIEGEFGHYTDYTLPHIFIQNESILQVGNLY